MSSSYRRFVTKIIFLGVLIAILSYLFHPGVGHLTLIINGEAVPESLARLAAIPTMLLVLGISVLLGLLMFFGVGLFIFLSALLFAFFGIILVAPYFSPILVIIFLVIVLLMFGNDKPKT